MISDRTYQEAADWLVRQQDDAVDWNSFTLWLEADPRRREAYNELALIEGCIDDHRSRIADITAAPPDLPLKPSSRPKWGHLAALGAGAVAAGIAAVLLIQPQGQRLTIRDYHSGPKQSLDISIGGGALVVLAPASHLLVDGSKLLLQGDAYFDVPHKVGHAISVRAGSFQVTDIGTRFAVESDPEGVSVEVAEGSLEVTSRQLQEPILLSAGHGMSAATARDDVHLFKVAAQQVASWREGRLEFDNAPLALVAREISRYSARPVRVDARIANQPFSGVIAIDKGEEPARSLAQILSLDVTPADGVILLEPRGK